MVSILQFNCARYTQCVAWRLIAKKKNIRLVPVVEAYASTVIVIDIVVVGGDDSKYSDVTFGDFTAIFTTY